MYIGQYIIPIDGILKFNSFNITLNQGVYFTIHSLEGVYGLIASETNEAIIIILILNNDIMSILGLDSVYTVKYSPLPSGDNSR